MVRTVDVNIGTWHGEHCTCHPLEPVTVRPVIVNDDCPGATAQPRRKPVEIAGRIAITWPAPQHEHAPLGAWAVQLHDLDNDQPVLTATGLRIVIGGEGWHTGGIYADVTRLVGEDGKPLPNNGRPVLDESGGDAKTGVFRYAVAEMRVAEPKR
jgi:hypothetical protein